MPTARVQSGIIAAAILGPILIICKEPAGLWILALGAFVYVFQADDRESATFAIMFLMAVSGIILSLLAVLFGWGQTTSMPTGSGGWEF